MKNQKQYGRLRAAWLTLFLAFITLSLFAQKPGPKREFRAVWVATVVNIDYPKRPTVKGVAHREQWKNLLSKYQKLGFNAVIVQIRTAGDAFYPSDLVPWSKYLTGTQGRAPEPLYDPLEFMIEQAHNHSMEFHAWLNPFRASLDLDTAALADGHMFNQNRDWMIKYGRRYYFNPAIPAVRKHLTDVVAEIVEKYNIDAIHFDDYFYPYKIKGEVFPDSADYAFYGRGFKDIEDWRRSNIDALIEIISQKIKEIKPHVSFGISPFGVWRNREKDPTGSDTKASVTCYDDLYADVLKWLRMEWIDYVVPQLYWNIGFPPADHAILLEWWSSKVHSTPLYIGHAAHKVGENQVAAWHDPYEIPRQIALNRRNVKSQGSVYFSSRSILRNNLGLKDSLSHYYARPALLPEMEKLGLKQHAAPKLLRVAAKGGKPHIIFKADKTDWENLPAYYVLYRFEGLKTGAFEDAANLLAITPFYQNKKKIKFSDKSGKEGKVYTYAVKAVNRQHSESPAGNPKTILKLETGIKKINN